MRKASGWFALVWFTLVGAFAVMVGLSEPVRAAHPVWVWLGLAVVGGLGVALNLWAAFWRLFLHAGEGDKP